MDLMDMLKLLSSRPRQAGTTLDKKDKRLRYLQVGGSFIAICFEALQMSVIACWLGLITISLVMMGASRVPYAEYKLVYPVLKKCVPAYSKKWLSWLYEDEEIPRCIIKYHIVLKIIFGCCTILCIILKVCNMQRYYVGLLSGYLFILVLQSICLDYELHLPVFMQRFKKINKYNIRYAILPVASLTRKWPVPTVLGKCKIINYTNNCPGEYVDVQMQGKEEIQRSVLITGSVDEKKVYKLQEICHVKYII